jgi:hypothetical protein
LLAVVFAGFAAAFATAFTAGFATGLATGFATGFLAGLPVLFDAGLAALFAGVLDLLAGMTVISYTRFGAQICTPTRSDGIA